MSSSFLSKLVAPQLPAAALGLEASAATVVLLDRRRRGGRATFELRRAATLALPARLVNPSFDETNITDSNELFDALSELVTSAGLARQRKWSVALPEAATRTVILTLESAPASRAELEEVLRWKIERGFGHALDDLRVRREALRVDARGRARYLATGARLSVIAEYEDVFARLGWRAGLLLPRHMGEARWLTAQTSSGGNAVSGDALLVSAHQAGFTAVLMRDAQPLVVRAVLCDDADFCADELYRLLLFYRDRLAPSVAEEDAAPAALETLKRLLVVDTEAENSRSVEHKLNRQRVSEIVGETLGASAHTLEAADVGLVLPTSDLSFNHVAAPAGLAALAWS